MKKHLQIPASIKNQSAYKRIFTVAELYRTLVQVPAAIRQLAKNQKNGTVNALFIERLQLAVTHVNACPACSYAHAYMALKAGMDNEEIQAFLRGANDFVSLDESRALLFAQHFAAYGGRPQRVAYEEIELAYGPTKARIILAAVQVMLMGNIFGLPYSALSSRFTGKPYSNSSLLYELGMLLGFVLLLPIAMVHAAIIAVTGQTAILFSDEPELKH